MKCASVLVLAAMLGTSGCAHRFAALEARATALEAQNATLRAKIAALEKQGPRPTAPVQVDPEREFLASALFREANDASDALDFETAKAKVAELLENYPETRASRKSHRLSMDLALIGTDAGNIEVDTWFQGNTTFADGKATVVVFWEQWCHHCRREVPKIQATYERYKDQGLNVVSVTKVTKNATNDSVEAFISEHMLTYPVAKETGAMSLRFGVRGVPAAAVVKDGKIAWRGHPAKITDTMIASWLSE